MTVLCQGSLGSLVLLCLYESWLYCPILGPLSKGNRVNIPEPEHGYCHSSWVASAITQPNAETLFWADECYIWFMRHGRAEGSTNVRALNCPCYEAGRAGIPPLPAGGLRPLWLITFCLSLTSTFVLANRWAVILPSLLWVNSVVLLGGLAKRRVTCLYHQLGVVASGGGPKLLRVSSPQ